VLGTVNIDNQGIAGIEKYIDGAFLNDLTLAGFATGDAIEPVSLALDLRAQHVVRDELQQAMERYQAIAAVGIVLDVNTGEVIAMSSLPDYDPNNRDEVLDRERMNRATVGVYEMGSTFKGFTTAMALDSGRVGVHDSFDARGSLRVGGHSISDFHGKNRVLTVPEIFIYSSNIGTARMALAAGTPEQESFLEKLGLLTPLETELPEVGAPLSPQRPWSTISSVTIAFGHGISVSPMQTAVAGAALVNGGYLVPATFFPRTQAEAAQLARPIMRPETSDTMRHLFRLNVLRGSGRRADVPGYIVGGKTGTAEKVVDGRYSSDKRRNAFLAAFPMDAPKYLVLVLLDEPKPEEPGMGATAGLNAAPTVSKIIARIAPMLGVEPRAVDPEEDPAMALASAQ
jgi:cell division protein FtsI (penicillin-binding protein 3)